MRNDRSVEPQVGWLQSFIRDLRLTWHLFNDSGVPSWTKFIPVAGLLYILSPIDLLPDVILGLGQLDDLTLWLLVMRLFISSSPEDIVRRYLAQMSSIATSYRIVEEDKCDVADTIDSTARPLLDEHLPENEERSNER